MLFFCLEHCWKRNTLWWTGQRSQYIAVVNPKSWKLTMMFGFISLLRTDLTVQTFWLPVKYKRLQYDWVDPVTLIVHRNQRWKRFIKYWNYQWISRDGLEKIRVFEEDRTNNAVESNNATLHTGLGNTAVKYLSKILLINSKLCYYEQPRSWKRSNEISLNILKL